MSRAATFDLPRISVVYRVRRVGGGASKRRSRSEFAKKTFRRIKAFDSGETCRYATGTCKVMWRLVFAVLKLYIFLGNGEEVYGRA